MRKKSYLYQSVHLTEGWGVLQARDVIVWLALFPFRLLRALFYPPLPTLLEIAHDDLERAQQEIQDAQRDLLQLRYKTEALQSKIEMGRKRVRRIEVDIGNLSSHGDLDAVPTLHQVVPPGSRQAKLK